MPFTNDEMVFLRKLAVNLFQQPLDPADSSKDTILTRKSNTTGAGYVPDDPAFYTDLQAYGQKLGFDPVALLVIMASESNYNTGTIAPPIIATPVTSFDKSLAGHDVAPRGLIGFTATNVPSLMTVAQWDQLPALSSRDQLGWVARSMQANLARVGGRPFSSAYELYLANASPGSMTQSGKYDLSQTLYSGNDWLDNLAMDQGPGGDTAYSWAAKKGETALLPTNATRIQKAAYAGPLVQSGVIKGKVTLGDLERHSQRMQAPGWNLAWQLAARRYKEAIFPPIQQAAFVPDDSLTPFPNFQAPSSTPEEPGPGGAEPPQPIARAPNGSLAFPVVGIGAALAAVLALGVVMVVLEERSWWAKIGKID